MKLTIYGLFLACAMAASCSKCPDEDTDDIDQWILVGPKLPGRTTAIMFDKSDSEGKAVFAGSSGGGLWYNSDIEDQNSTWHPVTTNQKSLVVSTIAQNPTESNKVYFGTGLYYIDDLGKPLQGNGMYKKNQIGAGLGFSAMTFTIDNPDFQFVNAIRVHPTASHIYVATMSGVHRSTNDGDTFEKVMDGPVTDLEILDDGSVICVVGKNFQELSEAVNFNIWKSSNGDAGTWGVIYTPDCPQGGSCLISNRARITYAGGTLYTLRTANGLMRMTKSVDQGATWLEYAEILDPANQNATAGPSARMSLCMDPVRKDEVYVGAAGLTQVITNGTNNTRQFQYPTQTGMVDIHAMDVSKYTSNGFAMLRIVLGTDMGIFRLIKDQNRDHHLKEINNGYFTPLVRHHSNSSALKNFTTAVWDRSGYYLTVGGYTEALPGPPTGAISGESRRVYYDTDDNVKMISGASGGSYNLYQRSDFIRTVPLTSLGSYNESDNIHYGGDQRQLQTTRFYNDFQSDQKLYVQLNVQGFIAVVKHSPHQSGLVFVGTTAGEIVRVEGADGNNPTQQLIHGPQMSGSSVVDMSIGDNNQNLAVLLDGDTPSIWHQNVGIAWQNITADFPNIPATSIIHHPDDDRYLYVGTYQGLMQGGLLNNYPQFHWFRVSNGLPTAPVVSLTTQQCSNMILVGLFGRGVYYMRFP